MFDLPRTLGEGMLGVVGRVIAVFEIVYKGHSDGAAGFEGCAFSVRA